MTKGLKVVIAELERQIETVLYDCNWYTKKLSESKEKLNLLHDTLIDIKSLEDK